MNNQITNQNGEQIAIIQNGKIITIMPKKEYDLDIIGQYKIATQKINQKQANTNVVIDSNLPVTEKTLTEQVGPTVIFSFVVPLFIGFIPIFLICAFIYRQGKKKKAKYGYKPKRKR